MSTFLEIQNLIKVYPKSKVAALNDINLFVEKADVYGIIGHNGAGKTTLLRIISGLLRQTSGKILINGKKRDNNFKHKFGYVPQDISLYDDLTIIENINFFGKLYKLSSKQISEKATELLKKFEIFDIRGKNIKTLSGGMKRRVNLIVALLHNPEFIILDEPTVGVDVQSKKIIIDFLLDLSSQGVTMLYTSHLLDEAQKLCNKIAVIKNGKIIENDSTKNILIKYPKINNLEDIFIHITANE